MNQIPAKLLPLFQSPHTHNLIKGGRGGAKTRTVPALIIDIMAVAPLQVLACREIQKSLKQSSYKAISAEIFRQNKGHLFKLSESCITSRAGGRIDFIGLQNHTVDSIKSYEDYHWAWVEEAQSVSAESLKILIPTLRTDGYFKHRDYVFPLRMFLYTYNPYEIDDAIERVLPESREDTQYITINYYDNPWFPESLEKERQEAKKTMSTEEYQRIWEGIPFTNGERAVMQRTEISAAMARKVDKEGGKVVGVDVARFGSDKTVFFMREGLQQTKKKVLRKKDTQEVARQAADFGGKDAKYMVDDTGVGGGVTDKLRDMGYNVVPINFGGKPKNKKKYPDIISEMWFEMADQLDKIGLLDDDDLLVQLASRNFKYTTDEKRKVESKEEYKKRTGRNSPDEADAAILCYYNRGGYGQMGGV